MIIPTSVRDLVASGPLAHLTTINPDGSPQVTMEHVRIRACTLHDIDAVIGLERQWEQEDIAYGDFNPMCQEAYVAILERFPAYFLVVESDGQPVGYSHAGYLAGYQLDGYPAVLEPVIFPYRLG